MHAHVRGIPIWFSIRDFRNNLTKKGNQKVIASCLCCPPPRAYQSPQCFSHSSIIKSTVILNAHHFLNREVWHCVCVCVWQSHEQYFFVLKSLAHHTAPWSVSGRGAGAHIHVFTHSYDSLSTLQLPVHFPELSTFRWEVNNGGSVGGGGGGGSIVFLLRGGTKWRWFYETLSMVMMYSALSQELSSG